MKVLVHNCPHESTSFYNGQEGMQHNVKICQSYLRNKSFRKKSSRFWTNVFSKKRLHRSSLSVISHVSVISCTQDLSRLKLYLKRHLILIFNTDCSANACNLLKETLGGMTGWGKINILFWLFLFVCYFVGALLLVF